MCEIQMKFVVYFSMESSLAKREENTNMFRTISHAHAELKHAKHSGIKTYLYLNSFWLGFMIPTSVYLTEL